MEVTWKRENQQLPFVLEGFSTVTTDEHVYFFGGADNDMIESNTIYQYNLQQSSFVKFSVNGYHSPAGRSNSALAFKADCLYVFGGLNQTTGWLGDAWKGVLKGDTVSWEAIDTSDQFTPRDKMAFCQSESAVYLIGGFGPIDAVESEEEEDSDELKAEKETQQAMSLGWFDEVIEFNFNSGYFNEITWKSNEGIAGKAAANAYYSNGEVYIFGGRSPTGRSDQLVKLSLKSSEWEEEKPGGFPPAARSFGASVNLTPDSFLVFGGTDRNDSLIAGLHLYQKSKWMKIETSDEFITPRRQSALAVVNDKEILLFGGVDKVNKETGVNSVLSEIWRGQLGPLTNKARVDMADVFGLKRKSN